jgi:hypothetical protein
LTAYCEGGAFGRSAIPRGLIHGHGLDGIRSDEWAHAERRSHHNCLGKRLRRCGPVQRNSDRRPTSFAGLSPWTVTKNINGIVSTRPQVKNYDIVIPAVPQTPVDVVCNTVYDTRDPVTGQDFYHQEALVLNVTEADARTNESRDRQGTEPDVAGCLGSPVGGNRIVERAHRGIRSADRANRPASVSRVCSAPTGERSRHPDRVDLHSDLGRCTPISPKP